MEENGINVKDLRGIGVQVSRFEEVEEEGPEKTLSRWLQRETVVNATDTSREPNLQPLLSDKPSSKPKRNVATGMSAEIIDLVHDPMGSNLTPSQVLFLSSLPPDLAMEQRRLLLRPEKDSYVPRQLAPAGYSPKRKMTSPAKIRPRQRKTKTSVSSRDSGNKIQV